MYLAKFFIALASLYRPRYIPALVEGFVTCKYSLARYIDWYTHTNTFKIHRKARQKTSIEKYLVVALVVTAIALLFSGAVLIANDFGDNWGVALFGFAILFATPIILAFLLPIYYAAVKAISGLLRPKSLGKIVLCKLLEAQATRLRQKYSFKVIAVAGSMGKTSTKLAIAQTLTFAGYTVRYQEGNYNDRLTVPLVLFDQSLPALFNIFAWVRILLNNERTIKNGYPYDVAVLELGTDAPGQIEEFAYLAPDIAVVTGVAAEHMEFFGTLDAVAKEELTVIDYAKKSLINTDDVAARYLVGRTYTGYGLLIKDCGYYAATKRESITGQLLEYFKEGKAIGKTEIAYIGSQGRKIVLASIAVADMLGVSAAEISKAISQLKPFAGRMQILDGLKNSVIIDDTYNATPAAVEAALSVLQQTKASKRIAVLGSMNELGAFSAEAHRTIGSSIDPGKVDLVVTIGQEAMDYLAPAAKERGCIVMSFLNPHDAGVYVKKQLVENSVVLFKGSQNGVFSEEAIKPVLKNKADSKKLVRQSKLWMNKKRQQFTLPA